MPTKGMWLMPQGGSANKLIRRAILPGGAYVDANGVTFHLGKYDAPTDSWLQVPALYGKGKDNGGSIGRWAQACDDPASADVLLNLYKNPGTTAPTDNDGVLKFTVGSIPGSSGRYPVSWDFVVQYDNQTGNADPAGRSTGTVVTGWTFSGGILSITSDWVSPHQFAPYGSYKITPKVTRTFDTLIPSPEYDAYQQSSNQVSGTLYRYVDPRADQ